MQLLINRKLSQGLSPRTVQYIHAVLRRALGQAVKWGLVHRNAATPRTLRVRVALQRVGGKLQFVEPKTIRSGRTIAVPGVTVSALKAHRARQLSARLAAGVHWVESGLVFTSSIGTPLEPRNVTRHFHKVLLEAGLPKRRFHDLRHTCASLLLAQEVPPRVVMEILGHSQIALTMNTYSHVMPVMEREAADRMDAALGGA